MQLTAYWGVDNSQYKENNPYQFADTANTLQSADKPKKKIAPAKR
jgi:hypothetical protein